MPFLLLVWVLAFNLFSIDPLWTATAVLASAMPVGISSYIFAQKYYQGCEAPIAAGIVISTLGCVLTLTLLLSFLRI